MTASHVMLSLALLLSQLVAVLEAIFCNYFCVLWFQFTIMTDMENPSSSLISSDSSKSIVSNGAEASVIYTFDSSTGQNEKVAPKVRKKSYCTRHNCCVKCALCLLVATALIFVALGSAMTMVSLLCLKGIR